VAICTMVVIQFSVSPSHFIRQALALPCERSQGRSWIEISREFDVESDHVAERSLGSALNLKF